VPRGIPVWLGEQPPPLVVAKRLNIDADCAGNLSRTQELNPVGRLLGRAVLPGHVLPPVLC
jgi:hypothetical protein